MNCLGSEDRLAKNLDGNRSKDVLKTDGLSDVRGLGGQNTGGGAKWTQHHEVIRPLVIFAA